MSGEKFNSKKCPLDLIDPLATEGLGWALYYGREKYAAHNWALGLSWADVIGAAKRHLLAIERGEDIDEESGLPHVDCLGAEWMFLSAFMKTEAGTDDRRKTQRTDGWTPAQIKPIKKRELVDVVIDRSRDRPVYYTDSGSWYTDLTAPGEKSEQTVGSAPRTLIETNPLTCQSMREGKKCITHSGEHEDPLHTDGSTFWYP